MKKTLEDAKDRQKLEDTNALLYKYSHRIFYNYVTTPEIRIIIQIICEKAGISAVIANNPTLQANEQEYRTRLEKLEKRICNTDELENLLFE